ncbi:MULTISPECIES: hypothetical protein [unclassified Nostoc]|uniref:hypothetical protein n=1 Tax=unclassified Nostoc TaxID=2593658 RepID=UPI002AD3917C|nr:MULTISPECIES: hypothetical protein [unclassified Nostoc]MDZ8123405.1 hypothetical protein [Nostoc sp. CmiVER01]MDZ8225913.1 hypothetical protein [Nostoc sp. ChiVER01]
MLPYGSYYQRCLDAGKIPKSNTEFSRHLVDLCNNILSWKEVTKSKTSQNNQIVGLKLRRKEADDHIPTLEEKYAEELDDLPSIPSTIESQQAFQPSTIPSTTASGDELISNPATFTKSGGQMEDGMEGTVEGLNPYQGRIVEGMEGKGDILNEIFNQDEYFKIGDVVSYVGKRYATTLGELKMVVASINEQQYSCKKPDGYFTPWVDAEELAIHSG